MAILGDVGGMYGSLYSIGWIFVGFLSHRLFIASCTQACISKWNQLSIDKEKCVNSKKLKVWPLSLKISNNSL
jgi:hypothetical protein